SACERQARRSQRRKRVVGRLAGPHQIPQRLLQLLRRKLYVDQQVGEEAGSRGEPLADRGVLRLAGAAAGGATKLRRAELGEVLAEVQRDAPGASAQCTRADPDDLA